MTNSVPVETASSTYTMYLIRISKGSLFGGPIAARLSRVLLSTRKGRGVNHNHKLKRVYSMFNNDLTLAGTSTSKTYSLTSIANAKSIRLDATAPLGEPRSLVISHQVVKRNGGDVDAHLVRLDDTISGDSVGKSDVVASVRLIIEAPREVATAAQVKDVLARLVSFVGTSGYTDKLLNSEP